MTIIEQARMQVGQDDRLFRRMRPLAFQLGLPYSPFDYDFFATQSYQLRSIPYRSLYSTSQQWSQVTSEISEFESVSRSRLDQLCSYFRSVQNRPRTIVKLFGRRRTTLNWDVLLECDVPAR